MIGHVINSFLAGIDIADMTDRENFIQRRVFRVRRRNARQIIDRIAQVKKDGLGHHGQNRFVAVADQDRQVHKLVGRIFRDLEGGLVVARGAVEMAGITVQNRCSSSQLIVRLEGLYFAFRNQIRTRFVQGGIDHDGISHDEIRTGVYDNGVVHNTGFDVTDHAVIILRNNTDIIGIFVRLVSAVGENLRVSRKPRRLIPRLGL